MEVTNSNNKRIKIYQYLAVCLFVTNKRKNSWTDWARIFVGPHMTPRKVYGHPEFQNLPPKTFDCHKILRIHEKYDQIRELFCYCFIMRRNPALSGNKVFLWKVDLFNLNLLSQAMKIPVFLPSSQSIWDKLVKIWSDIHITTNKQKFLL